MRQPLTARLKGGGTAVRLEGGLQSVGAEGSHANTCGTEHTRPPLNRGAVHRAASAHKMSSTAQQRGCARAAATIRPAFRDSLEYIQISI